MKWTDFSLFPIIVDVLMEIEEERVGKEEIWGIRPRINGSNLWSELLQVMNMACCLLIFSLCCLCICFLLIFSLCCLCIRDQRDSRFSRIPENFFFIFTSRSWSRAVSISLSLLEKEWGDFIFHFSLFEKKSGSYTYFTLFFSRKRSEIIKVQLCILA